jgi:hypothetical protein
MSCDTCKVHVRSDRDRRMSAALCDALELEAGDELVKKVWRTMFVMGAVDKATPVYAYEL